MEKEKMYIGLVGQIASGKGELKNYLVDKLGFASFSLSSLLHEDLKKQGVNEFTRETLQDMGDKLRKKYGEHILAKRAMDRMKNRELRMEDKIIIEGIRNTGEIEFLKRLPNFVLIGVKAKRELRFKRLLQRAKPWDPKTWDEFLAVDRRDLGIGQKKSGQQVEKCLTYCDYMLDNNKDVKDFKRKVKNLMKKILKT